MANPADDTLVADVQAAAKELKVAAAWSNGQPLNVADDFLYEMYLLFTVVNALLANHDLVYDPGVKPTLHAFPMKPANKKGRPRFLVMEDGEVEYQICAGTTAEDIVGKHRAPDISIQDRLASDTPDFHDVLMIMDAKYRTTSADRLSAAEFSQFARWIELFELPSAPPPGLNLGHLGGLLACCLVTNGDFSTEPTAELVRKSLVEVRRFYPGSVHDRRP